MTTPATPATLATHTAAGRAAIAAVTQERSIGRPVFLRYTDDAPDEAALFSGAAAAVDLAGRCLGPAESLYATALRDSHESLTYLTVTLRHPDGGVAQLGFGLAHERRSPPGLLLIGDQGTLESNPAATGAVYEAGPAALRLRDEPHRASHHTGNLSHAVVSTIRRSLQTGRVEPLGGAA